MELHPDILPATVQLAVDHATTFINNVKDGEAVDVRDECAAIQSALRRIQEKLTDAAAAEELAPEDAVALARERANEIKKVAQLAVAQFTVAIETDAAGALTNEAQVREVVRSHYFVALLEKAGIYSTVTEWGEMVTRLRFVLDWEIQQYTSNPYRVNPSHMDLLAITVNRYRREAALEFLFDPGMHNGTNAIFEFYLFLLGLNNRVSAWKRKHDPMTLVLQKTEVEANTGA